MKKILLIGNGPCIFDSECGKEIDNFDGDIVRFNQYKIQGYEKYIGMRTNVWFVGKFDRPNSLENYRGVYLYMPDFNSQMLADVVTANLDNTVTIMGRRCIQDLRTILQNKHNFFPTAGMLAIYYFIRYYEVYIHGFDFFTRGHEYFDNIDYLNKKIEPHIPAFHDPMAEKTFVMQLIDNKKVKYFERA